MISGSACSETTKNKLAALASVKAIPTWKFDDILKDGDPAIIDYGDGTSPPVKGIDSIKHDMNIGLDQFKAAFPDFQVENLVATASGNDVMVWGTYSATLKKDFMGQKATGKSFKMPAPNYFVFNAEGKVTEHRSTSHNPEMAKQIGMKY